MKYVDIPWCLHESTMMVVIILAMASLTMVPVEIVAFRVASTLPAMSVMIPAVMSAMVGMGSVIIIIIIVIVVVVIIMAIVVIIVMVIIIVVVIVVGMAMRRMRMLVFLRGWGMIIVDRMVGFWVIAAWFASGMPLPVFVVVRFLALMNSK